MKPSRLQKHSKTQNDDDQREFQTEDIDVITENTNNVHGEGEQRTEVHCPPPPPYLTEISKMHYVCIYIYMI